MAPLGGRGGGGGGSRGGRGSICRAGQCFMSNSVSVCCAVTLRKQCIPCMFYLSLFAFSPGDMTAIYESPIFNPNIRCHNMSYKVKSEMWYRV